MEQWQPKRGVGYYVVTWAILIVFGLSLLVIAAAMVVSWWGG